MVRHGDDVCGGSCVGAEQNSCTTANNNNKISSDKKYMSNAGNFDHRADVTMQCRARRPMEHIPYFTRSHWMPPSVECLRPIAKFVEITQNTIKQTTNFS
jgi:hypothetical protein